MSEIGFITHDGPNPSATPEGPVLLRFDSGRAITFDAAMMHTGVTGASGTGKSKDTAVPAICAAIPEIPTILILDPKGNEAPKAVAAAQACGREGDIRIIGTIPAAEPVNIIRNMDSVRLSDFARRIFDRFTDGSKSGNMDFHMAGFAAAGDLHLMLNGISEIAEARLPEDSGIPPHSAASTLPLITELLGDPKRATALFRDYLKIAPETPELSRLKKSVEAGLYHPMNQADEDRLNDSDHRQHLAWNSDGARRAISSFLDEPGIIEKFCDPAGAGLDMDFEGKITIFSFAPGAGFASGASCRLGIENFIKWVFKKGIGGGRKLIIGDEAQEYLDLSGGKLSDVSFLALAREYGCGCFYVTQSYSGLAARFGEAGLAAFTANMSNKIFMHNEDGPTRMAAKALGSPDLVDLSHEVFAATYDAERRDFVYGVETLEDAYRLAQSMPDAELAPVIRPAVEHAAEDAAKALDWLLKDHERQKAEEARKRALELSAQYSCEERQWDKAVKDMRIEEMNQRFLEAKCAQAMSGNDPFEEAYQEVIAAAKPEPAPEPEPEFGDDDLRARFPSYFRKDAELRAPAGFIELAAESLSLLNRMGLEARISKLSLSRHDGRFQAEGSPEGAIAYLNRLLTAAKCLCAVCGKEIEPSYFNLCDQCLQAFPQKALSRSRSRDSSHNASHNASQKEGNHE